MAVDRSKVAKSAAPNNISYLHFAPLPADAMEALTEAIMEYDKKEIYYITRRDAPIDGQFRSVPIYEHMGKKVTGFHIGDANRVAWPAPIALHANIIEAYLELLCDYVNVQEGREVNRKPGEPSLLSFAPEFFMWLRNKEGKEGPEWGLEGAIQIFKDMEIHGKEFLSIQHIFIPCTFTDHTGLVVISPLSHRVEFFDSYNYLQSARAKLVLALIFQLIAETLGKYFQPEDWEIRTGSSPLSEVPEDGAVYACTNALYVALRYPIYPTVYNKEIVRIRRQRICSEIIEQEIRDEFNDNPEIKDDLYKIDMRYPPTSSAHDSGFKSPYIGVFSSLMKNANIPLHKHIIGSLKHAFELIADDKFSPLTSASSLATTFTTSGSSVYDSA